MAAPETSDLITRLLAEARQGDGSAAARLLPLVYDELRAIAQRYFRDQPARHTLEPTALVHEAYLRLVDQSAGAWRDRAHFLAVCALAMRQILADHARRRAAAKRGGGRQRLTLAAADTPARGAGDPIDLLALDEALDRLAQLNERQARIVQCRFFSDLTLDEIAAVLQVSKSTVEADWRMARAWLGAQLGGLAAQGER